MYGKEREMQRTFTAACGIYNYASIGGVSVALDLRLQVQKGAGIAVED